MVVRSIVAVDWRAARRRDRALLGPLGQANGRSRRIAEAA